MVVAHSDVGLQHGSTAIYNAFCDRVPIYLIAGNALEINARRPGVEWDHSVQDAAAIVRDCLKWDDVPRSLDHFAESAVRAYKIAMTPPMAPVLLVADGEKKARDRGRRQIQHPQTVLGHAPAGRFRIGGRGGADAGGRGKSCHLAGADGAPPTD